MKINNLPEKTVERLSKYRRSLLITSAKGKTHIFSHEIANMLHITSVQVRRDLMLIGHSGTLRKGYDVKELIDLIGIILDIEQGINLAVVGLGNLGRSIIGYISGRRPKLKIVAAFDTNPEKIDKIYSGIMCYHLDKLNEIVKKENIEIGVITVPADAAPEVSEKLVLAGIKGILNFSPRSINVSSNIYLEEFDMITSLEKVAYFVKR
jgi:redox-sensing transcriptional repressor